MTPMQEESIRMIVASGDLLLTVVNDVLDWSKLESGNFEIDVRKSNLQETLNAILHSIQTKAASKHIHLATYYDAIVPEFVHTDCRRIQQILYNLLGNAIKFSPPQAVVEFGVLLVQLDKEPRAGEFYPLGAWPNKEEEESSTATTTITAEDKTADEGVQHPSSASRSPLLHRRKSFSREHSLHDDDSMVLRFVVKDYGQGIRPDDFQHIFEPFRQARQESDQAYGGTGLGLAITGKLVKALGGTVSVASKKIGRILPSTFPLRIVQCR